VLRVTLPSLNFEGLERLTAIRSLSDGSPIVLCLSTDRARSVRTGAMSGRTRELLAVLPLQPSIDQSSCPALCCVFRSAKLRYHGTSVSSVRKVNQNGPTIAAKACSNGVLNAFVDHGVARPAGRLESAEDPAPPRPSFTQLELLFEERGRTV
jgi:hypothetical protein